MSSVDYTDWVLAVHRKVSQFSVVFLQLGASNEPARRVLLESHVTVASLGAYLAADVTVDTGILLINDMESLTLPSAAALMGTLRERVFTDVEGGARVILLSRAPRIAFPSVVGSSLLDDASLAHAPIVKSTGADGWPACLEDGTPADELLCRTLTELGTDLCASLDRVVYENLLTGDEAMGLLTARELEALDGSSLTAADGVSRTWNFPKYLAPLKRALDEVLADALEPQQQLAEVSGGLWKIERIIRRAVRQRAISAWADSWRTQCLKGDLQGKVLERATESAYLGATSVKQLRDPLEWLSLGELLQLKERSEIGGLGLSPAHWRLFSAQIMPIRNRLAHMRSLRPEDAADVVKWQRVLELRLPTT